LTKDNFNKLELEVLSKIVEIVNNSEGQKKFIFEYNKLRNCNDWNVSLYDVIYKDFENYEVETGRIYFKGGEISRIVNKNDSEFNKKILNYILCDECPEEIEIATKPQLKISYKKPEGDLSKDESIPNLVG